VLGDLLEPLSHVSGWLRISLPEGDRKEGTKITSVDSEIPESDKMTEAEENKSSLYY
jgi:hypothetical protein